MDEKHRLVLSGFALGVVFTLSVLSTVGNGKNSDAASSIVDGKDYLEPTQYSSTSHKEAVKHRGQESYFREVQSFWPSGLLPENSHPCADMVPKPRFVNRTLIIIRTGVEMLKGDEKLSYLKYLSERLYPNEVRILVDVTLDYVKPLDDDQRNDIRANTEEKTNVTTIVYSVFDILNRYPSTKWPLVMDPEVWKSIEDDKEREGVSEWVGGMLDRFVIQGTKVLSHLTTTGYVAFLNFLIHEPSFVWAYVNECETSQRAYKAIWVLESDVLFAGNERVFFDFYETIHADLVSVFEPFNSFVKSFFAWNVTSEHFPSWPVHKWEHVERYSASILRFLDAAIRRNYTAHGEYLSSTLCAMVPQCASVDLREHGYVNPDLHGFQSSRGISKPILTAILHCRSIEKPDCREVGGIQDSDNTTLASRLVTNDSEKSKQTLCRCCGSSWHNKWLHSLKNLEWFMDLKTRKTSLGTEEEMSCCEQDVDSIFITA